MTYIIDECPTCGLKLRETNDHKFYYCNKCAEFWMFEELEVKEIQQDLGKWME